MAECTAFPFALSPWHSTHLAPLGGISKGTGCVAARSFGAIRPINRHNARTPSKTLCKAFRHDPALSLRLSTFDCRPSTAPVHRYLTDEVSMTAQAGSSFTHIARGYPSCRSSCPCAKLKLVNFLHLTDGLRCRWKSPIAIHNTMR